MPCPDGLKEPDGVPEGVGDRDEEGEGDRVVVVLRLREADSVARADVVGVAERVALGVGGEGEREPPAGQAIPPGGVGVGEWKEHCRICSKFEKQNTFTILRLSTQLTHRRTHTTHNITYNTTYHNNMQHSTPYHSTAQHQTHKYTTL